MAGDLYFANVGLLCHFDGTNGQTTTTDSSSAGRTVTRVSSINLSTAQAALGTASTIIGPILGQYWSCADSADWAFGAGQFTVEFWWYPTAAPPATESRLVGQYGSLGNRGWFLGFADATHLRFRYTSDGSTRIAVDGAYTPTLNAWVHMAVDRDGSNVLRTYAGGAVIGSAAAAVTLFDSTAVLIMAGDNGDISKPSAGFIDELRITKGVARYAGAFTPPIAAFPDVAFTNDAAMCVVMA